jgi:hypothetical protein
MDEDAEHLRRFAKTHDEGLFRTVVDRHVGFVYAVNLRRLRDAHLAGDATQAVFIALARKAAQVAGAEPVRRWLHRSSGVLPTCGDPAPPTFPGSLIISNPASTKPGPTDSAHRSSAPPACTLPSRMLSPNSLTTALLALALALVFVGCGGNDPGYSRPLEEARLDGIQKRRPINSPEWFEKELRDYLDDYPKNPRGNLELAYLLHDKTDPASAKARTRALKRANTPDAAPRVRLQAARMLAASLVEAGDEAGAKKLAAALLTASASSDWNDTDRATAASFERSVRFRIAARSEPASARGDRLESILAESPDDPQLILGFVNHLEQSAGAPQATAWLELRVSRLTASQNAETTFVLLRDLGWRQHRAGRAAEAVATVARARTAGARLGIPAAELDRHFPPPAPSKP